MQLVDTVKTLIVDNYDSFTYNLWQLISQVNGAEALVVFNDELSYEQISSLSFDNIVISPGPGRPDNPGDFGVCAEILARSTVPVLGVCLGHQGLACASGGRVAHAPEPMHGRTSRIHHDGSELFAGIPDGFLAVRYHSLVVMDPPPPILRKTAWTADGLIMGLQHRERPCWGVQFHPESICTEHGFRLLANFRDLTARQRRPSGASPRSAGPSPAAGRRSRRSTPGQSALEVRRRTLDRLVDAEQCFVELFGAEPLSFWLDSSRVSPGASRFSAMGGGLGPLGRLVRYSAAAGRLEVTSATGAVELRRQSIFDYLDEELSSHHCEFPGLAFDFQCGFVGYLGYELKWECAAGGHRGGAPEVTGGAGAAADNLPDAMFILADRLIVFDHLERTTHLLCLVRRGDAAAADAWFDQTERRLAGLPRAPEVPLPSAGGPLDPQLERDSQTYLDQIRRCQRHIQDGESYELCLTNQLQSASDVDPLWLYRVLRRMNSAPYAAFLRFPEGAVLCSSPERFLRIERSGWAESRPIKGTRPRGATPAEDAAFREDLHSSLKDRAENLMIVDLVRNDLGRVCEVGTVTVPRLMEVETYATVHQLVSTIRGHLHPSRTAMDCIRSAFPGGSMTGAPKRRSMEILEQLEGAPRGIYSGGIGYFSLNGAADINIVIRTIVLAGGTSRIGIGGAIIALSDPEEELAEALLKGRVLVEAMRLVYARRPASPPAQES